MKQQAAGRASEQWEVGVGWGTWAAPSPQQAVLLFTATKEPSALKGPPAAPCPKLGT